MFEAFLATTSSEGLSALGMREQRSYELVSDAARDRLGPEHAALFGEPVATAHGDQYDWYAAMEGRARKLLALDEEEQSAARATLGRLTADIRGLAQELADSGSPDDLRLGEALANAVQYPGDDYVHVVEVKDEGGVKLQPVLVNWAWISDRQRAVPTDLRQEAKRRPPKPALPVAPVVLAPAPGSAPAPQITQATAIDRTLWLRWLLLLGWLLLAILCTIIVLLLVRPCAINGPAWLSFCVAEPIPDDGAEARGRELQNLITQAEKRIAIADRACQPLPPAPAEPEALPAPAPTPEPGNEIQGRLNRAGAMKGDLSISLAWNSKADLDLSVTCPRGQTIWYRNRNLCKGELDVDSNARKNNLRNDPVENVFYVSPDRGIYKIGVTLFATHGASVSQPFELLIRDGDQTKLEHGVVTGKGKVWSTTINYAGTR
ncbi:MAG: hypothetical protein H6901_06015 [Rhodobacteraceae bacterium]|nr:hypothetical protein [Paracoccaceae bacterium]MCP5341751.1 hypothetical protein [Paracoccaceae bacterium]